MCLKILFTEEWAKVGTCQSQTHAFIPSFLHFCLKKTGLLKNVQKCGRQVREQLWLAKEAGFPVCGKMRVLEIGFSPNRTKIERKNKYSKLKNPQQLEAP